MMDFSAGAGLNVGGNGVIPAGQLAWAIVNVRAVKPSQKGGQYLDIELTLDDGQPYARRKIWEMVGDPFHQGNSETYRQMGMSTISRMLECARGAGPNNPQAYSLGTFQDLNGLRVAIKVKIEKGTGGYDDKNKVAEWLTPNPTSSGHKEYQKLISGVTNVSEAAPAAPAQTGFGAPQPQQQAPQQSFSQPQPQGATAQSAAVGFGQNNSPQAPASGAMSPSSQPSWLTQANGQ